MTLGRRVAIITGAGSGIGKAVAMALAREGFAIVLAGRRQELLDAAVNEGLAGGAVMLSVPTDVRDPSSVKALFSKTWDTCGRLDLLFNNAGQSAPDIPMEELTYEQWRSVVDTNLTGAFL